MRLRDDLRTGTLQPHRELEARLALDDRAIPFERYRGFIRGMRAFVAAVEPALEDRTLLDWGIDMRARSRLAFLDADLEYLGIEPAVAPATALPALESPAQRLGCAYVLEGATLGGSVLFRTLAPRFDLTPRRGAAYLHGHGEETGRLWKAFVQALDSAPLDERGRADCVRAASATFRALGDWLAQDRPATAQASGRTPALNAGRFPASPS